MDVKRVDDLVSFALLFAGEQGFGHQDLGEIHLLKYVYLADLEHASRHGGETFTGAAWRFHSFGPWDLAVQQRIPEIAHLIGATVTAREMDDGREYRRYRAQNPTKLRQLDNGLPYELVSSLKRYIKEHGNDKAGLLGFVYRTPPMLHAAPGEPLNFKTSIREVQETPPAVKAPLSRRQEKKLEERRQEFARDFNDKLQEKLAARKARRKAEDFVPPRYDETFYRGTAWLDSLAGEPIQELTGEATVSDEVWKSQARTDGEVP